MKNEIILNNEIKELEISSGIKDKQKELKIIEKAIKEEMINNDLDYINGYKLKRNVKIELDENKLEKEYKNVYNKCCIEKVSYKLSKDMTEEE